MLYIKTKYATLNVIQNIAKVHSRDKKKKYKHKTTCFNISLTHRLLHELETTIS